MLATIMKLSIRYLASALVLGAALLIPAVHGQNPPAMAGSDMVFDVRNGDQTGKLMLKDTELAFESLTDARHSRNWPYADIRELSKGGNELRVRPFRGDKYAFQFKDKKLRDRLYSMISDRIVAARQSKR